MSTQEISRADWTNFFDTFSRQHEGWLATLELFDPEVGAQELVDQLPLEGVSVSSEAHDLEDIAINFGGPAEDHISHVISGVTHVWLVDPHSKRMYTCDAKLIEVPRCGYPNVTSN